MRHLYLVLALVAWGVPAVGAQPSNGEGTYLTPGFAIAYQTDPTDPDAPPSDDVDSSGVPDAIERLGRALEVARAFLIDEWGFPLPPGEGRYQVYVIKGEDVPHVRIVPVPDGRSRETFMVVPPHQIRDAVPQVNLDSLMAHEYFHAIQYGYDYLEQSWFHESTASLMQDVMHPELHLRYWTVPYFLTTLERGLAATDGKREYGEFVYWRVVQEQLGLTDADLVELVRNTLELSSDSEVDALAALDQSLALYGTDLGEMWARAQVVVRRPGTGALRESLAGSGWLKAPRTLVVGETCRQTLPQAPSMPAYASDFTTIRPRDVAEDGTISVTGPAGSRVILMLKGNAGQVWELAPDGAIQVPMPLDGAFKLGVSSGPLEGPVAFSIRPSDTPVLTDATTPVGTGRLRYGLSTRLRGQVSCGGAPAAFARLIVREVRADGSRAEYPLLTDEEGNWNLTVTPDMDATFAVEVADPLLSSVTSSNKAVLVEQFVTFDAEVLSGLEIMASGTVTPSTPGATLRLQYRRPEASRWRSGPTTVVDEAGGYLMTAELPADGVWEVRTVLDDDLDPLRQSGTSVLQVIRLRG